MSEKIKENDLLVNLGEKTYNTGIKIKYSVLDNLQIFLLNHEQDIVMQENDFIYLREEFIKQFGRDPRLY